MWLRVSTHSRPKAAGDATLKVISLRLGFNTQPPEGGWIRTARLSRQKQCFNTQPPEGGWPTDNKVTDQLIGFQHTAARRRLASGKRQSDCR